MTINSGQDTDPKSDLKEPPQPSFTSGDLAKIEKVKAILKDMEGRVVHAREDAYESKA
jgi:hypothetical protein